MLLATLDYADIRGLVPANHLSVAGLHQCLALYLTRIRFDPLHLKDPLCLIQAVSRNVQGRSPDPRVVTEHLHSGTLMPFAPQGVDLLSVLIHNTAPPLLEAGGAHFI